MLLRSLSAGLATVLLLASLPVAAAAPPVKEAWDRTPPKASAAWVRRNPVPGRPSAGYLTIAGGGQPDTLLAVTAPGVRIELHSMTMTGGVMAMQKLESLPVPAGNSVALAPGGNHLMIFGLPADAASLPLTLQFASGAKIAVKAEIRAAAAAAPMAMDHAHP